MRDREFPVLAIAEDQEKNKGGDSKGQPIARGKISLLYIQ